MPVALVRGNSDALLIVLGAVLLLAGAPVQAVVLKALAKEPDERFASMAEFNQAIEAAVSQQKPFVAKIGNMLDHVFARNRGRTEPAAAPVNEPRREQPQPDVAQELPVVNSAPVNEAPAQPEQAAELREALRGWLAGTFADDEKLALIVDFDETMLPQTSLEETAPLQLPAQDPVNLQVLEATYGAQTTRDLLNVFVATAERLLELLEDARRKQRTTALQLLAHQLKGASAAVGCAEITRLSGALEAAAGRCDVLQVRIICEGLRFSIKKLSQFVAGQSGGR